MGQTKSGDRVKVHYTGKFENEEVFDSSRERQPLEFTIGKGDVIPGFEGGVVGMEIGESKRLLIPPEEGYGSRREDLVVVVKRSDLPKFIVPTVGKRFKIRQPDGQSVVATIADIDEDRVTLDGNHPLAGHTLLFDVELLEIA